MYKDSGKNQLSRRNAIRAFSAAGFVALSGSAFSTEKGHAPRGEFDYRVYANVQAMREGSSLREGMLARTAGYYTPGDGGGAEYLISAESVRGPGDIILANGLNASLANPPAVNYKIFGAIGDGKNDDGVQIKIAHQYANEKDVPLINYSGEYWIRETSGIEIMTNVQWGQTVFHIDEKFNTRAKDKFVISPREQPVVLEVSGETKAKLLTQLKPGVTIIPELAPYKNSLMVFTDNNDRIGVRSGAAYNGRSTKAREEFFFVEEHGRILGDIAWGFNDFTKITAYPASNSYLVLEGGTFYYSGERTNEGGTNYVRMGFTVNRSRTVIRNQWIGLEKGMTDDAIAPRNGMYSFSRVYDVLLENIRMIPWEKNRPGTENDVPHGTYGIGGSYVLNATFRNVTAEGSPVHWGVFGTNLFKNFRVEQCVLNRIDVHFYCLNLYIKDTKVGTNGITITGGGDLFVENTTCRSNNFISFRRDFGATWDGDIRIRNCRHAPTGEGTTAILSMMADDTDYKYPIGYGRTLKVEDMVVDFNTVPESAGVSWLMRLSPFSRAAHGQRVFFPSHLEFRNVMVVGREQGMRLIEIPDPQHLQLSHAGSYDGVRLKSNCKIIFEDIHLEKLPVGRADSADQVHLLLKNESAGAYDRYSLYPQIRVARCNEFAACLGGSISETFIEDSTVVRFYGSSEGSVPGSLTFNNCKFAAEVKDATGDFYRLDTELGTSFCNCVVYAPLVEGKPRPDLIDRYGFVKINKAVHHNHLNTRLGNDILSFLRSKGILLDGRFISMLKAHHELEVSTGQTH